MKTSFTKKFIYFLSTLLLVIGFERELHAQITIEVGNPTSTTSEYTVPLNFFYGYSNVQSIYLASEIGMAGEINAIRYYWTGAGSSGITSANNWKVFIGHTALSAFATSTTASVIPSGDLELKFSGLVTLATPISSPQWVTITFDEPFVYNGTDNLLISVFDSISSYPGSSSKFKTTATGSNYRSISMYSDSYIPNHVTPTPYSGNIARYTYYPNIQFDLSNGIACAGVPDPGTIDAVDSICAGIPFSVTTSGSDITSGLSWIWQSKLLTGGTWTTIPGATLSSLNVSGGILAPTQFRSIVSCGTAAANKDTSNVITVYLKAPTDCFCEPVYTYGCASGARINSFRTADIITNIINEGTGCGLSGTGGSSVVDYTSMIAVAQQNTAVNIEVEVSNYNGGVAVFVDYNENGLFEASEKVSFSGGTIAAGSIYSGSFTIPITTTIGSKRMRVIVRESYAGTEINPCEVYSYGEIEDYTLNVIAAPDCEDVVFPGQISITSSPLAVCGSGDVNLSLITEMPNAANVSYQWKKSNTLTGTYTNIGTATLYNSDKTATITTNTYVFLQILCNGVVIRNSDTILIESIDLSSVTLEANDGQTCGPGEVTLIGAASSGHVFWYNDAAGNELLYVGDTFVTPVLTTDQNYFVSAGAYPGQEVVVGTGVGAAGTTTPGPLNQYYRSRNLQYLYTAEELTAAGLTAGNITRLGFDVVSAPPYAFPSYKISIKFTTDDGPLVWHSAGFTEVFSTSSLVIPGTGWFNFNLNAPQAWNGTDNIVVQICWNQVAEGYSASGTVKSTNIPGRVRNYQTDGASGACGTPGTSTDNNVPNLKLTMEGCQIEVEQVTAYVRPVPDPIYIGEDATHCIDDDQVFILDAGVIPENHEVTWDNGATGRTRGVNASGTYYAIMSNQYGCISSDTVEKIILFNPNVDLGSDTTVCLGGIIQLDAGDGGADYYWNTGADSRYITVNSDGVYNVMVTAANGCYAFDTIRVTVQGVVPTVDGIIVTSVSDYTFNFKALNPLNVLGYEWDFGDGTAVSNETMPNHTYATAGDYEVRLKLLTDCGGEYIYITTTHIVSVDQVVQDKDLINVYPNPTNGIINIESKGDALIESILVYNISGQKITEIKSINNKKSSIQMDAFASGVYLMKIGTNKGDYSTKFEYIR